MTKRQEKGVLAEHQRTLQKMGQYKKKKVLMPGQGDGDVSNNKSILVSFTAVFIK